MDAIPILKADPAYRHIVRQLLLRFNPTQLAIYVVEVILAYSELKKQDDNVTCARQALHWLHQIQEEL